MTATVCHAFLLSKWYLETNMPCLHIQSLTMQRKNLTSDTKKGNGPMKKSIHTKEYAILLRLFRKTREKKGVNQETLAKKLQLTQSQLSKMETGETRIDVIQLRLMLQNLDVPVLGFIAELETELAKKK